MARHHGRFTRVYMGITSAGVPEPLIGANEWSADMNTDFVEVTAWGDANKQWAAGLPNGTGSFGGAWDETTKLTYTAALDGLARKVYFYEDAVSLPTSYFYGAILPGFSITSGIGAAVTWTANWNATGVFQHS